MSKKETQTEQPENLQDGYSGMAGENTAEMSLGDKCNAEACEQCQQDSKNEPATSEQKITDLEAQLAEIRDQLLRKAAEFENFRKRMNQEKQNSIEYANQSLLSDIIPIIDDFERAIQAGVNSTDYTGLLEGIKMIEKRLTVQLEAKWGLKRYDSAGELFDPNLHEALMMEKSPDVTEATVKEDLFKGYLLKDRVIRAAKVKVLMPETNN
ncbi:MAG: nucleotide exchange factor GrpE [Treponema sp.]|nr:nucleotide exchange factor GrpE [Treponema sp.]